MKRTTIYLAAAALALMATASCGEPDSGSTSATGEPEPVRTISQARSNLGQEVPGSLIAHANGLEWVLASPCRQGGCSSMQLHHGWRFMTAAEWNARPPHNTIVAMFQGKCASRYFDVRYDHCDWGDVRAGYYGSGVGLHYRDHPNRDSILVRGSQEQPNRAPTINSPGNKVGVELTSVSVQVSAADADGDDLSWSASGLPGGLSINSIGKIVGTIGNGTAGNYSVTVTVSDGEASANTSFSWRVYNDAAPTISFTSPSEAWHGSPVTASGSISEPGCDRNPSLQTSGLSGYALSGSNGTWTFTKNNVGAGAYVPATVTVVSACNGKSASASRSFGVDVGDPTIILAQAALNQGGVNPNDDSTWPALSAYDTLTLLTRASDSVSGIRSIGAVVRRTDNNAEVTIFGVTNSLDGTPAGGPKTQTVSACNEDDYCDESALDLESLSGTNQVLRVTVTDAGGRSVTNSYYFRSVGLRPALVDWRDAIPQSSENAGAQTRLNQARAYLAQALESYDAESYGNITLSTQLAQAALLAAKTLDNSLDMGGANTAGDLLADVFVGFMQSRVSGYVAEIGERNQFNNAIGFLDQARDAEDIGTRLNLMANAWFWMEDGADPMEAITFEDTQSLLGRIIGEINAYVAVDPALPGQSNLSDASTTLGEVKVLVDRIVADGDTSISDLEHVNLLLGLTNTAEDLKASQSLGAWVRNWQWGLSQITYIYAARALGNARDFIGAFHPVFLYGQNELAKARTFREDARADDFMNLLIDSRCLTIAIYNKAYNPDVEAPQACCELILSYQQLDQSFPVQRSCTNQAPTVTDPGAQAGNTDDDVTLAIEASDPDGDDLEYSATSLPPGLSINSETGVISGTISGNDNSPYTVVVTVSDGLAEASTTFTWTVEGGGCGGWTGFNNGCWYTAPRVGMTCNQVCAPHGGLDRATTQHSGRQVGIHFWPGKRDPGRNWVAIECSSTDNNTNWGANGQAITDSWANWRHSACYVNCSCNE